VNLIVYPLCKEGMLFLPLPGEMLNCRMHELLIKDYLPAISSSQVASLHLPLLYGKRASSMQYNIFYQAVSRDFVPHGRCCEWCGQPAVQQLTALGGLHHNQSGCFCLACGKAFIRAVTECTSRAKRSQSSSQARSIARSTAQGRRVSKSKIPAQVG